MHRLRADGPLDGIVVDVEAAVVEEALELGPAPYSVADRFSQFGLARDALELGVPALEQFGHDRRGSCAPGSLAYLGFAAADFLFDAP
jgi:hypothetical protein